MKKLNKFISILIMIFLSLSITMAFTPQDDINLRNYYAIWNATTITAANITSDEFYITNPPAACPSSYFMTQFLGNSSTCGQAIIPDGSVAFTGDVDIGDNNMLNISGITAGSGTNGYGVYPDKRIFFTTAKRTVTVCDSGCDYTLVNDIMAEVALFPTHQLIVQIYSPYTAYENVYIPPFTLSSDMTSTDIASHGVVIQGNPNDINEIEIASVHAIGGMGAISPLIRYMKITGVDPNANENTSTIFVGTKDASLQSINFSGSSANLAVVAYAAGVSIGGIDLGNQFEGGFISKHTGYFHFEENPNLIKGWNNSNNYNVIGNVSKYVYWNNGGTSWGFVNNGATAGELLAKSSRGLIYDATADIPYGVHNIESYLTVATDLTVGDDLEVTGSGNIADIFISNTADAVTHAVEGAHIYSDISDTSNRQLYYGIRNNAVLSTGMVMIENNSGSVGEKIDFLMNGNVVLNIDSNGDLDVKGNALSNIGNINNIDSYIVYDSDNSDWATSQQANLLRYKINGTIDDVDTFTVQSDIYSSYYNNATPYLTQNFVTRLNSYSPTDTANEYNVWNDYGGATGAGSWIYVFENACDSSFTNCSGVYDSKVTKYGQVIRFKALQNGSGKELLRLENMDVAETQNLSVEYGLRLIGNIETGIDSGLLVTSNYSNAFIDAHGNTGKNLLLNYTNSYGTIIQGNDNDIQGIGLLNISEYYFDNSPFRFSSLAGEGMKVYSPSVAGTYLELNRGGGTFQFNMDGGANTINSNSKDLVFETAGTDRVNIDVTTGNVELENDLIQGETKTITILSGEDIAQRIMDSFDLGYSSIKVTGGTFTTDTTLILNKNYSKLDLTDVIYVYNGTGNALYFDVKGSRLDFKRILNTNTADTLFYIHWFDNGHVDGMYLGGSGKGQDIATIVINNTATRGGENVWNIDTIYGRTTTPHAFYIPSTSIGYEGDKFFSKWIFDYSNSSIKIGDEFGTVDAEYFYFEVGLDNYPEYNGTFVETWNGKSTYMLKELARGTGTGTDIHFYNTSFGNVGLTPDHDLVIVNEGTTNQIINPVYMQDMSNFNTETDTEMRSLSGGGFEVYSASASQTYFQVNRGGGKLIMSLDSTSNNLDSTNKKLAFKTGGNTRMTIATSSNVININPQSAAPATCVVGDIYVDTSGAYCACGAVNTWSNMIGTGTCS